MKLKETTFEKKLVISSIFKISFKFKMFTLQNTVNRICKQRTK